MLSYDAFIKRIIKYTNMEINTIMLMFYYLNKLVERRNVILVKNNVYRILLGLSVLAIKYNEDKKYKNSYYANVGGLKLEDFNNIEYILLVKLNLNLCVKKEEFDHFLMEITTQN